MFLPGKDLKSFIKQMFDSFDTDKSGFIDFKEFLIGIAIFESNDEDKSFTRFLFKVGDKDNSKGIDRLEFKQMLSFCLEANNDLNTENEVFEVSKSEIDNKIEVIFEKHDSNRKGFLNENEFANAFADLNDKKNF